MKRCVRCQNHGFPIDFIRSMHCASVRYFIRVYRYVINTSARVFVCVCVCVYVVLLTNCIKKIPNDYSGGEEILSATVLSSDGILHISSVQSKENHIFRLLEWEVHFFVLYSAAVHAYDYNTPVVYIPLRDFNDTNARYRNTTCLYIYTYRRIYKHTSYKTRVPNRRHIHVCMYICVIYE